MSGERKVRQNPRTLAAEAFSIRGPNRDSPNVSIKPLSFATSDADKQRIRADQQKIRDFLKSSRSEL